MPAPTVTQVTAYLGPDISWDAGAISDAFDSERAAQARVCNIPQGTVEVPDPDWPADLVEALCRRVAVNLALRSLPLGVQVTLSDVNVSTTRVGGGDAEVRRLEGPFRKYLVG